MNLFSLSGYVSPPFFFANRECWRFSFGLGWTSHCFCSCLHDLSFPCSFLSPHATRVWFSGPRGYTPPPGHLLPFYQQPPAIPAFFCGSPHASTRVLAPQTSFCCRLFSDCRHFCFSLFLPSWLVSNPVTFFCRPLARRRGVRISG